MIYCTNARRGLLMLFLTASLTILFATHSRAAEYTITNLRLLSGDTVGDIHPYSCGDINNSGQAVGYGFLVQDHDLGDEYTSHPCFYDPKTAHFVNLGDMTGDMGESGLGGNGYAISDTGWVTGRNYDADGHYWAFYWKDLNGNGQTDPGEMNNLGVEANYDATTGAAVNNVGQVVGIESRYGPTENRGWLWTDANAYDAGEKTFLGSYIFCSTSSRAGYGYMGLLRSATR